MATTSARQAAPKPSAPLRIAGEFRHEWESPAEWTARLRELSPTSEEVGWLALVWEPGDPWAPVQRWELYEMLHPRVVDPAEVRALRGAHPRSAGHICTDVPVSSWAVRPASDYQPCFCWRKINAWRVGEAEACELWGGEGMHPPLTQWRLFQRTGYVGRRFWILQGAHGGHQYAFTHQEGLLLEAAGLPADAPPPGSLSYAPFDERVVRQIVRRNRLREFHFDIQRYRQAMGAGYAAYKAGIDKELRKQLLAHLTEQMADVNPLFLQAMEEGELDKQPRTRVDYDRLDQMNDAHYVETGQMLSQTAVL